MRHYDSTEKETMDDSVFCILLKHLVDGVEWVAVKKIVGY